MDSATSVEFWSLVFQGFTSAVLSVGIVAIIIMAIKVGRMLGTTETTLNEIQHDVEEIKRTFASQLHDVWETLGAHGERIADNRESIGRLGGRVGR